MTDTESTMQFSFSNRSLKVLFILETGGYIVRSRFVQESLCPSKSFT